MRSTPFGGDSVQLKPGKKNSDIDGGDFGVFVGQADVPREMA